MQCVFRLYVDPRRRGRGRFEKSLMLLMLHDPMVHGKFPKLQSDTLASLVDGGGSPAYPGTSSKFAHVGALTTLVAPPESISTP